MAPGDAIDRLRIERLIAGDQTALRELIVQHWQSLVAMAMGTTNSEDLAIEAAQDAFIRLWNTRASLDPARPVKGVLCTIVRYRALDIMRTERTHIRVAQRLSQEVTSHTTVSRNAGEQAVDVAEFNAYVVAAIHALPPRCREVFLMNRKARMSYADIADTLGISVPTARNQMSLALQRIAQAIAEWRRHG